MPRWPVRAVDCAHFAPPTQRTRRDGWFTAGPFRFPSRLAETTMRPFRPLLRPAAPTVLPFRFR